MESHRDHLELFDAQGPAIILAGSSMCTGRRIVDHLRRGIERPENDILFVSYQAAGTSGRTIQDLAPKRGGYVFFDGERKWINAGAFALTGYSVHAGKNPAPSNWFTEKDRRASH